jgi:hypothetical protein
VRSSTRSRRSPSPLRRRGFALLWSGGLVSDLGDWTLLVGLPVFVFQLTGSALTTSTIFVAELIPALVVGQVGGVLVDRLGVGVDVGAHLDAPSSLSELPASARPRAQDRRAYPQPSYAGIDRRLTGARH